MSIDNEIARRNYALSVETFDCEHLLQISCGDEILVTVAQPAETNFFAVFNGNGLDENDNDLPIDEAVKLIAFTSSDQTEAWRQIARYGYLHALGKMMTADQREERDTYGLVA